MQLAFSAEIVDPLRNLLCEGHLHLWEAGLCGSFQSSLAPKVEGFFGKAFIDPYLSYRLGNVLVSMRTS